MQVLQGHSQKANGREAVAEATEGWAPKGGKLDLLIVFSSTTQDANEVAKALSERYPGTPTIGCTTAGEHLGKEHYRDGLVVMGLITPRIRWATALVESVAAFDEEAARAKSDALFADLKLVRDEVDPQKQFCLTFIDGLSCKEESVSSLMADALEGLPLLGGSAGDDLKFKQTFVYHGGKAWAGGAVFALADSSVPFEIIKHQHYTTTPKSLVITRADVNTRRVYEMDGHRAIDAYAKALGMPVGDVTTEVTFMHPLTFVCDNEIYVRSIQRVEPDGSIIFFCGIEEGMVLSVGGHEDMQTALDRDISGVSKRMKGADLFIACNCILRALEAEKLKQHAPLGGILSSFPKETSSASTLTANSSVDFTSTRHSSGLRFGTRPRGTHDGQDGCGGRLGGRSRRSRRAHGRSTEEEGVRALQWR